MKTKQKTFRYGLLVVLLCGMAASSIGICVNCTGVFYAPVSESLGVLRGSFALHATLSLIATAVTSLFVPRLMRRVSYKLLLIAGVAAATLATAGMAFSNTLWMFYLLGIIRGIGAGLFSNVPMTIILTNWFHQKHGTVTSITLSFSGLAGAVCSPLLTYLIQEIGWRNAYLGMALLLFLFALPSVLYPFTARPEDMGVSPYGESKKMETAKSAAPIPFSYRTVCFLCFCGMSLLHTTIAGIAQHFTGFSASLGMSAEVGALMMSLSMAGNIGTKLFIGFLSDRFGPVKASVFMIGVNAFALSMLWYGSVNGSVALLYFASFCYGSVYSVGAVGFSLLCRYLFGTENYPKAYAVSGPLINVGSALSLPLIGYLYDFTGSYINMLWIGLLIHCVDLILLWVALKKRPKRSQ